jgi:hypothetical protein
LILDSLRWLATAVAVEIEATVADGEAAVAAEARDLLALMQQLSGEAVGDFDPLSWLSGRRFHFEPFFRAWSDIPHRAFEERMEGVTMID